MSDLIIGGQAVPVDATVRTWRDHALEFRAGSPGVRRRFVPPDSIVWHWTAGEGTGEQVYHVLRNRRLGVELCIDREGVIWQYCDPACVDARDCGSAWDRRSVGVEVVCYGMGRPYSRPWNLLGVPARARDREVVEARLRGRRVYVAAFYPAQVAAAFALSDALRSAFGIRLIMPRDETGRVIDRPMTTDERLAWRGGELGHMHCTTAHKVDPGTWFLDRLAEHHAEVALQP